MAFVIKNKKIGELKKIATPKRELKPSTLKGQERVMTPAILANKGGQPCKIEQAGPLIIKFIRQGNTYECACGCARVSYAAFALWMRKAKEEMENGIEDSRYIKFFNDVRKAENDAEREVLGHWVDCIPGNWQAAKEFLARRNPEKWGAKDKVDVTSNGETVVKPVFLPLKQQPLEIE